ncbi:MAG: hypothetical protein AAF202_13125 [Pseudomonadota bacterium]
MGYLVNTSTAVLHKSEQGEGEFKIGLTNLITDPLYGPGRTLFWCKCDTKVSCLVGFLGSGALCRCELS